jgi:hypothetical protein
MPQNHISMTPEDAKNFMAIVEISAAILEHFRTQERAPTVQTYTTLLADKIDAVAGLMRKLRLMNNIN